MRKAEIAEQIQKRADISKTDAAELLDCMLALIKSTLQRGEDVSINGFGKFTVRSKRARAGRNPRTGEALTIAERRVATFKASALFRAYVNGERMSGQEPVEPTNMSERSSQLDM
jgi:nucleoid DNA-binding protein